MHAIYAILLPDEGTPEEIFDAAEAVIESVADENNWFSLIGLVRADGTVVPANDPHARWDVQDLAKHCRTREDWLKFVQDIASSETTYALDGASGDDVRRMVDKGGKEALIRALAAVIVDETKKPWKRNLAARQAAQIVWDDWPYPEELESWYTQRVYKAPGVEAAEAAIVLADIHT